MVRRTASADDVSASVYELAHRLVELDRRAALATGLGPNDARILRHLAAGDPAVDHTPATIAKYLGISSASVTALIDRLEALGFVERRPNPKDRRSVVVRTTLDRDSEVTRILNSTQRGIRSAAERLTAQERLVVAEFMSAVAERID